MRIEKKATLISSTTAGILVLFKLAIGIISGSVAVLASAIDSLLDLSVSIFNFFALHQSERKPDENFNFGLGKLEAVASVVEGTIISISGLFILYSAIDKIITPRAIEYIEASMGVMLFSIILTGALVLFLNHVAKKNNNLVIRADALHYKTDLFTNGAILLSLGIIHFSGFELIDPLLGIGIAIYMITSAFPILKEGLMMLLDVSLSKEEIARITTMLNRLQKINGHHHLQTRRAGSDIFVSVHLVFDDATSLLDAHKVSDQVESMMRMLFPNDRVHPFIHTDPYDDSDINEMEVAQLYAT
ncbi:cation diffusion facilitator family transporter [Sulfurimonas sp. HSL-3221]|uniref:cation diffusion facilitator family transporter n=1 Tax=Sulfurimonadaceae TaxID=2771471 RepID=UPI001E56F043|nr:cation diffusion facilitator family transporter [Sulfurimonas sp. HSL-3221]UFS63295.1 cation diffusion facilitator family transporter [Sulfurimonas sp. HSL-3221]